MGMQPPLLQQQQHSRSPLLPQAPTSANTSTGMDYSTGSCQGDGNNNNTRDSSHQNNNEGEEEDDDFSPTPLRIIQSRHSQYQLRNEQQQQRTRNNNMECASPALSSCSAPASSMPSSSSAQQLLQTQHQQQTVISQQQKQQQQQQESSDMSQRMMQFQLQQQQVQQHQAQLQARQQQHQAQQAQQKPPHQGKKTKKKQPQPQQVKSKPSSAMKAELAPRAPAAPMSSRNQAFLLPTTMMPPSVLASVLTAQKVAHHPGSSAPASSTAHRKKSGNKSSRVESPQDVLQRLLSMRGYGSNTRIKADIANYDTMPSALQLASFGTELVKAIHTSDSDQLGKLLSCGLSPNPCNQFRDSIVDLVCKRANHGIFQCLVDNGCDLRVCDGFGRTPLHHCCWASEFSEEIATLILRRDWHQLLIEDKRGQTPLEYVRPDTANEWIDFLEAHKETLFPIGGTVPPLDSLKELRPEGAVPDPPNALPLQLAAAVSSGHMTPEEVLDLSPGMRERFE
jgi:hypothetical protein